MAPGLSGLAADSLATGAVGTGYGALYGAGTGDTAQERLANAKSGAVFGGVGGALATPLAEGANWVGRTLLSKPEGAASDLISQKMAQDKNLPAPQMTPAQASAAQASGQPVAVADLGGQSVRRLARSAANLSPDADSTLSTLTNERFQDQGPRLANFLQNMYGSNLNAADARVALKQAGKAATGPAYDQAMAEGANGVWSPGLANLIQSPSIQNAMRGVASKAADDAVVSGNQVVKNPFVNDAQGNMVLNQAPGGGVSVPTLQYWDYVKRGLDDQIGPAYRQGENDKAAGLVQLKQKLLGELDNAAPSYAAARKTAFDAFGASDALEAGENFTRMAPTAQTAQLKQSLAQMTPQQQDIFGRGMAGQLAQQAQNMPATRNILGMFNSPEMAQRLQLGMGPQRAAAVQDFLKRESQMDMLRTAVGGNSTTAKQSADAFAHGLPGMVAKAGTNPLLGASLGAGGAYEQYGLDPVAIAKGAGTGAALGLVGRHMVNRNAGVMSAVARQLAEKSPSAIEAASNPSTTTPPLAAALGQAKQGATLATARRGAVKQQEPFVPISASPWISSASPQPAYARGGKVKKPSHEYLVNRLMALAEKAKRAEKKHTAPILNMPDDAVTCCAGESSRLSDE